MGDRTVRILRDKKESCFTRKGLRVSTGLRSFDKLLEVGVSPYLGFTLYLSVLQCFGWFEALNCRLIGPKTWDRIIGNYRDIFSQPVAVGD